jgi:hypothetical protein
MQRLRREMIRAFVHLTCDEQVAVLLVLAIEAQHEVEHTKIYACH